MGALFSQLKTKSPKTADPLAERVEFEISLDVNGQLYTELIGTTAEFAENGGPLANCSIILAANIPACRAEYLESVSLTDSCYECMS